MCLKQLSGVPGMNRGSNGKLPCETSVQNEIIITVVIIVIIIVIMILVTKFPNSDYIFFIEKSDILTDISTMILQSSSVYTYVCTDKDCSITV